MVLLVEEKQEEVLSFFVFDGKEDRMECSGFVERGRENGVTWFW